MSKELPIPISIFKQLSKKDQKRIIKEYKKTDKAASVVYKLYMKQAK